MRGETAPLGFDEDAKAELDAEWDAGEDGILERVAARVVVFDGRGRCLLLRGHDVDAPDHSWWFSVGGGVGADGLRDGAVRELFEETGLAVDPERLVGPVLFRTAIFRFATKTRRQYEHFFVLRLAGDEPAKVVPGHRLTAIERETVDEYRWWTPRDIRQAANQTFYPLGIADMLEEWWDGWDGRVREMTEE